MIPQTEISSPPLPILIRVALLSTAIGLLEVAHQQAVVKFAGVTEGIEAPAVFREVVRNNVSTSIHRGPTEAEWGKPARVYTLTPEQIGVDRFGRPLNSFYACHSVPRQSNTACRKNDFNQFVVPEHEIDEFFVPTKTGLASWKAKFFNKPTFKDTHFQPKAWEPRLRKINKIDGDSNLTNSNRPTLEQQIETGAEILANLEIPDTGTTTKECKSEKNPLLWSIVLSSPTRLSKRQILAEHGLWNTTSVVRFAKVCADYFTRLCPSTKKVTFELSLLRSIYGDCLSNVPARLHEPASNPIRVPTWQEIVEIDEITNTKVVPPSRGRKKEYSGTGFYIDRGPQPKDVSLIDEHAKQRAEGGEFRRSIDSLDHPEHDWTQEFRNSKGRMVHVSVNTTNPEFRRAAIVREQQLGNLTWAEAAEQVSKIGEDSSVSAGAMKMRQQRLKDKMSETTAREPNAEFVEALINADIPVELRREGCICLLVRHKQQSPRVYTLPIPKIRQVHESGQDRAIWDSDIIQAAISLAYANLVVEKAEKAGHRAEEGNMDDRERRARYREAFLRVRDAFDAAEWYVLPPLPGDSHPAQYKSLVQGLQEAAHQPTEPAEQEAA